MTTEPGGRARFGFVAGLMLLAMAGSAFAVTLPEKPLPPCEGEPIPGYPALGAPPAITLLTAADAGRWTVPSCTAWHGNSASLVVGLAARFRSASDTDVLLSRIGAISSLRGVHYWSVTDKQWNAMFTRATALEGSNPEKPRGDFSAAELHSGRDLYFLAADNRSRYETVSRLRVSERDKGRIVIESDNVTPLRWLFTSFAAPGDVQTWYFLEHEAAESWRFYSLTRVQYGSLWFSGVIPNASYVNRALAMYRYIAGIPTDRDPPAAP
jgi:hypothetical protein